MDRKRIIACLDVDDNRCVKGHQFTDLVEMGDPIEMAAAYSQQGIDELVYLDISATAQKRAPNSAVISKILKSITVPLTVGGGIDSVETALQFIELGVDKILINSAAIANPNLINLLAQNITSKALVVAIDASLVDGVWQVMAKGGKVEAGKTLFEWAQEAVERGAGEILFTAIDRDGTKQGFHLNSLMELKGRLSVPIVASGGAGSIDHFLELFKADAADGALAASIFHQKRVNIGELKRYLALEGVNVRPIMEIDLNIDSDKLFKDNKSLVPAIIQDVQTLEVLMLGYMNRESFEQTLKLNRVTFFSRSREALWTKGESSGNYLIPHSITEDCDSDTLLIKVTPTGVVCHTGNRGCFFKGGDNFTIKELEKIIDKRYIERAEGSYTASLFEAGIEKICKKIGEESCEVVIEAVRDNRERLIYESADLLYHLLVLARYRGVTMGDIEKELNRRSTQPQP